LRLARFNANIDKVSSDFFQGLPIPSGALAMVGLVLLSIEFPVINEYSPFLVPYVLFFSFLMISNIPFNSFKKSEWVKRHKKRVFFIIIMLGILTAVKEQIMISLLINIYVFASLIYFIKNKGALQNMFQWKGEEDDESGDNQNDEL
jgi:CDP-diacylglycerol--serine O-phosphatidyltransferase